MAKMRKIPNNYLVAGIFLVGCFLVLLANNGGPAANGRGTKVAEKAPRTSCRTCCR